MAVSGLLAGCHTGHSSFFTLKSESYRVDIDKESFAFSISTIEGKELAPAHSISGLTLDNDSIIAVDQIGDAYKVTTYSGKEATVKVAIDGGQIVFTVVPHQAGDSRISLRLGGMPVAHGLGDAGAFEKEFNLVKNKRSEYPIINNGGGHRWLSTFAIFPFNSMAGVFFDDGKKSVTLSPNEYAMNITRSGETTFHYLLGDPKTIYAAYKNLRNAQGYEDVKPKYRLFELGWESWDALGWNTNQKTVQGILEKFHNNGYPIRWAVTGSGFWETGGTTTSFGRWGAKFPDPVGFKKWMNDNDIHWMIGLRTNLVPEGGPYYPVTDKRDKNLKVKTFLGNDLSIEAREKGFLVKDHTGSPFKITSGIFPIVLCYLVDGNAPGAADWYQQQYARWGVDGIKEDTMMDLDSLTTIYNKPITQIANKGGLVMARNGMYTAPGTLLRINDTGVRETSRRIPNNYFQYAASGYPNVYSDVAGVHNMHNLKSVDQNIRHAWLLALTAGMSVGAYPEKWPEAKRELFKKTIDAHYTLVPYMYSAAVAGYHSGYPTTLTPMTIAFPQDTVVAGLPGYQWMIGESLLAVPLLKNQQEGKKNIYLPQGTWYDYQTGKEFQGPLWLKGYELPLHKTPLFVGGKGVVVERQPGQEKLTARVYPTGSQQEIYTFTYPDGQTQSRIVRRENTDFDKAKVRDKTANEFVNYTIGGGFIQFPLTRGHDYEISHEE